jgi:hypothetical protein
VKGITGGLAQDGKRQKSTRMAVPCFAPDGQKLQFGEHSCCPLRLRG